MTTGMHRLGNSALLREVMAVLARTPRAPMSDVAAGVGVGRTTLYRHFGDREALVSQVADQGARMFIDALISARPETGRGIDALERICTQLFTIPDVLSLMFADQPLLTDEVFAEVARTWPAEAQNRQEDPVMSVIVRGQSDGSVTAEVPVAWAASFVFLTIGSGHLYRLAEDGSINPARTAEALELTIRAVRRTLATE
ncbi:TetR/AcrR family transcriptional regulator [Auritidibacter sp. NML130574]|uniref:TetR/AcrR family transcriptional regulator n=1 Tax=Auritidibacter sp. NML130574 TaxID=2170745 RepID=UPI000D72AD62|nr:TetR/AcrR family transcriptional regulator [Auritidibacter sp. NML130574]AXR75177.1 TetR/AcrR family transcriptional regulator [Auritidibacter sp. NML130574]